MENPTADDLDPVLATLGLGPVTAITALPGGSKPVFRLKLERGDSVVLKVFPQGSGSPRAEALAAGLLKDVDVPVPRFLHADETGARLPYAFAVMTDLPGSLLREHTQHPDRHVAYRQMGAMLRRLHAVRLESYGRFGPDGPLDRHDTNAEATRHALADGLAEFVREGADPALIAGLNSFFASEHGPVTGGEYGAVFAHDDFQPSNILVDDGGGRLRVSGLLDFGNARAADATSDLAKSLFCAEHEMPGSSPFILEGYGPLDHAEPERALRFYTAMHRMTMWWWLRRIGVLPTPAAPNDLLAPLRSLVGMD